MTDIVLHGDVYACLEQLDTNSIALAITSPPYWKQRDYGFESQVGQEHTSEAYIGRLVTIFHQLKQKLRTNGIFFLNIGDKYLHQYGKSHLLQIPYQLAYHMTKDGWRLEDIIIWYKPNHMPSPVTDRFTNTYEPILVFAKSNDNIYNKDLMNVVKIPLQQTPYTHTAIFPEALIWELINHVDLTENDLILDPFAGTGTVAFIVKKLCNIFSLKNLSSIMIEKGNEFIDVIQKRVGITEVIQVDDSSYHWKPVQNETLPNVAPYEIVTDKHGEVFIAENSEQFLSAIKGITTPNFLSFHREDAPYFFGVKRWSLADLYYVSQIYSEGYVLRNMLVLSNTSIWHPIFMFARDSTRVAYKFYLDRIRIKTETTDRRDWLNETFVGTKVRDSSGKTMKQGWVAKIVERYSDSFPKIVAVQWNGNKHQRFTEFVLHPNKDEFVMEGLVIKCPTCQSKIKKPYDSAEENTCPSCSKRLWEDFETICLLEEPQEVVKVFEKLEQYNDYLGQTPEIKQVEETKTTTSKFAELPRINWGASPGARKLMLGEYFSKMRLYRFDQPTIAKCLTLWRKAKNMSVQSIINKLPKTYKHTVGHWFRPDFGGSIPIPSDIKLLKKILAIDNSMFKILERTALKFQTVKASIKGKNPGDFIENNEIIVHYLKKLFIPPQ
jgi:site-specific DNA-methyltransferase (adenine-specific)